MAVEIERKFLVKNDSWRNQVVSSTDLQQAYICNQENVTIRIRITDDMAYLTIKGPTTGISRDEFEYVISADDARQLLDLRQTSGVIEKTRHKVRCGEHIWDLDIFYGENDGLKLAEVELQSETEEFELPAWAGTEVTGDRRYANSHLAEDPYCNWHDNQS